MIVSQEKEILLYKEAGNSSLSRTTSVTVEGQGKKPLETSPSTAAPTAAAALAPWRPPSRRAAIAKSSSTSHTVCDTVITRIIMTTRITSRAAGARLQWLTPSSRSRAIWRCGKTAGSSSTRAGSNTRRRRPRSALRPSHEPRDPKATIGRRCASWPVLSETRAPKFKSGRASRDW